MGKILRLENYIERPAYETEYKYVIKDGELLWEVAQHLTEDKDFLGARVRIGTTSKDYNYLATGTYFNGQRVSQILRVSHIGTALEIWLPPNDPTFESGSQIGALAIR